MYFSKKIFSPMKYLVSEPSKSSSIFLRKLLMSAILQKMIGRRESCLHFFLQAYKYLSSFDLQQSAGSNGNIFRALKKYNLLVVWIFANRQE